MSICEEVRKINIDYLLNGSIKDHNKSMENKVKSRDKKFYKKRICSLTRELLADELRNQPNQELKHHFNNYIKCCIHYFKTIDNSDLIQECYKDINSPETSQEEFETKTQLEADELMFHSLNNKNITLDDFVIKKKTSQKSNIILPQKKHINLRDPQLKLKGVKKKKNITNKYEDTPEKENDNKP
uniref:Uncharacterized protein n=1 Tax=viral metagenome TaxID=1070528 RepID=A0A6C0LMV9_9ZZZZ